MGKRLAERAYLSYVQGLDGLGLAVKLSYQFSKKWSVALTAGNTQAVDLLYTLLFD